ncbi:MAG: APC family permease, partial [Microbacterium sp.]
LDDTLLPKRLALPVFCSDPLSSVAYATEQIVLVLGLGGLALLHLTPWIGAAVVVLLVIVVASYRQTCAAYPNGGGAYAVSRDNLGEQPALVAASALLIDYVLTVAVSVVAGVAAITSAVPELQPHAVALSLAFVAILTVANLRGVKESGRAFAIPTYGFVLAIYLLLAVGFGKVLLGDGLTAESAHDHLRQVTDTGGMLTVFLVLRAFASGCTALTGVEAVSNGVPAFRKPKIRNAQTTLTLMGGIAILLFSGLTILALVSGVHYAENPCNLIGFDCDNPQPSLMAQVAAATFGMGSIPFYVIQAVTACVLLLAANTAFNGFPLLGSVLARDGYAPKALNTRGDRLVFSNGMIVLGIVAMGVLVIYQANLTTLIQLYIIGVFVSFSIGQIGMVRHWRRALRNLRELPPDAASQQSAAIERRSAVTGLIINSLGAGMTVFVLIIVTVTKFTHGAWLVFIAIPILATLMIGVKRYYRDVEHEIQLDDSTHFGAAGDVALVLVGRLQKPVLKAVEYALAAKHENALAIHIAVSAEESDLLQKQWAEHRIPMQLVIVESPYRAFASPVAQFIKEYRKKHGSSVVTVYLPQYIVGHWWESILHNRRARRIANQLMLIHGVSITLVPWLLDSSELIYGRRSRPLPGQERSGLPAGSPAHHHRVSRPGGPPEQAAAGAAPPAPAAPAEKVPPAS